MFRSVAVFAILVISVAGVAAQSRVVPNQSLALTNNRDDARGTRRADRPVSPEARAESRRLYKQGVKYGTAGLFQQAAAIFEKAVALDPAFAEAYFALGHAYFDMKRWAEAAENLGRAVELNPKDIEAQDRLSFARTMLQPNGGGTKPAAAQPVKAPPPEKTAPRVKDAPSPPSQPVVEVTDNKSNEDELALTRIYRIGPNDVLDVRTADPTASQSTLFTVTPSGLLEHPLLAEPMQVGGMTVDEVTARIESDLKRRALDNTKVSVGVRDYASHTILVSGLVKDSGTKILRREAIPLYVVVADAQPLPEAARVTVVRNESNQTFDIELSQSSQMNLLVRPGDVVTLHANATQFVYVGGDVKFPGEKTYRRGLTLTQAMIAAGGAIGKPKEARLGRDDGRGFLIVTKFKLKDIESGKVPDPVVRPGDRITVID